MEVYLLELRIMRDGVQLSREPMGVFDDLTEAAQAVGDLIQANRTWNAMRHAGITIEPAAMRWKIQTYAEWAKQPGG